MTRRNDESMNSRLREMAGALALLAGAGCTASPGGEAPVAVAARAAELGVGQCETFTANATKQYVSTGAAASRPWCGADEQLQTSSVFDNYFRKFDQAVQFTIPASIPIAADPDAGNAGNHHAVFEVRTYTSCEIYTAVSCVFRGGSDQAHPTAADQLAKAVAYDKFEGCYEGFKNVGDRGTKLDDAAPGGVLSGNAAAASVLNGGNTCAGERTQVTLEYQACGESLSGGAPACCDENLIKGGDFGECDGNNNNVAVIPDWVVTGNVDWWLDSPLDGCVVDLAGSPGSGKLAQVIPTTVGAQYELLVDVQANQYEGPVPRNIRLVAGDTSQDYVTGPSRATLTLPFTATEGQTLIELSTSETGYSGPLIDNVRVRPVVCDQTCDPSIPAEPPPTLKLTGTVRDFKFEHPDFEGPGPVGSDKGIVQPDLGPDGKPVYAGQDGNPTTSGKANFDQWFTDVPGVNAGNAHAITLDLISQDPPLYRFDSPNFFPADGQGFGNEGGYAHNYSFTYELATYFQYRGGETFTFTGDDDVWVFINNKLVIDLGGLHGPETATVDLDEVAATLGLTIGENYPLKLFFAERRSTGSSFSIETSIEGFSECTTDCNPITDNKSFVWQADKEIGISGLQGAYHDVDRDEVAVFSYSPASGGKVFDRITGALKRDEQTPPGLANIDGATYDPATKRALFVDQSCNLVEAPTTDLTNTTGFSLSGYGAAVCAGIDIGRDGNLYIVSHATNQVIVVSRDGSALVRKISTAGIFYGIDGILSIPGSNNFLIVASGSGLSAIIDSEGNVVVPAAQSGTPLSPLTGGAAFVPDGLLGVCSTGHIWACDESGTQCHDFAPAGGDVNTCPCLGEEEVEEPCVSVELIENGKFDGCPGNQENAPTITAWSITGQVDWWYAPGLDGCAVDLAGTPGPGKISQTIATVVGAKYTLTVDTIPNSVFLPVIKPLTLSAGATTKDYLIEGPKQTVSLSFTATAAQTLIELGSPDPGNAGPYVDNVSVVRDCEGGGTCQFPDLPPSDPGLTTLEDFSATVVLDLAKDLPGYSNLGDVERAVGAYWGQPGEGVLFTVSETGSPGGGVGRMTQDGAFSGWLVDPASGTLPVNNYLEYGYGGALYSCSSLGDGLIHKILANGTVENVATLGNCEGLSYGDRGDGVDRLYASNFSANSVSLVAADGTVTALAGGLSVVTGLAIPRSDSAFQPGLYAVNQSSEGTHRIAANNVATLDYPYSLGYGMGEVIGFAPATSAFGDYFYHLSTTLQSVVRVAPNGTWEQVVSGSGLAFGFYTMGAVFSSDGGSYFFTNEDNQIMRLRGCIGGDGGGDTDGDTGDTEGETTGGDGGVGTPCTVPADCEQLCVIGQDDTTGVCTEPCTAPGDCPTGWSCGELSSEPVVDPKEATGSKCWMFEGLDGGNNNAQIMACGQTGAWGPQNSYWPPYVFQPFVDGQVIWSGWGSTAQALNSVSTMATRDAVMAARSGKWEGNCNACLSSSAATYCLPPGAGGGGDTTGDTTGGDPGAGGGVCLVDSDCPAAAPECFNVPMSEGKRCGGCENDAQCAGGGCTFPNPYVAAGSYCGGGGAGEGCESNVACLDAAAPFCAPIMSKGILKVRTCGACRTNSDCGAQAPNCEPTLDLEIHLRGEMSCVANAALANGATCKSPGKASPACSSGKCAAAKVWSAFPMGVCGECLSNSDCAPGTACVPAVLDAVNNAATGSICQ